MAHHFTQSIGLLTMIAVDILVGPLPSAEAKETSAFRAHFVPVLAADGAAPAITFEKGKLRLKPKGARVRFDMDHVSAPPGTPGELVLSLMVNGGDLGEVTFPFEVMPEVMPVTDDREEAGEVNVVKVRAALTDALDLTPGDVVELLGAWVMIADEQVGALGFIVEALDEQPQTDLAEVVATLRSAGHTVELGDEVVQPFFAVAGQLMVLNDETVQVFEYEDATAAQADAALVSPSGSTIGTTSVLWVATPHFYMKGKVIALYVGDDPTVLEALAGVLGQQFAGGSGDAKTPIQMGLNENIAKWSAANISNYQYTYQSSCFCPPPFTDEVVITVLDGVIQSVFSTTSNVDLDSALHSSFDTVDGLFSRIQTAIDENAERISVSYDEELGYPTVIDIDFDSRLADEEVRIQTRDLSEIAF